MEENVDAAFVHNTNDGWIDRQGTCKVCKDVQGKLEVRKVWGKELFMLYCKLLERELTGLHS